MGRGTGRRAPATFGTWDIARQLVVSPHTVDAHLKHIYTKLGVHSRVELTVLAMQHRAPLV